MKKLRVLEPSGELENLQKVAATETNKRAEVWKHLLEADVWVVGTSGSETELNLHTWTNGEETCPVFTSQVLLETVMEPNTPWLMLKARIAFGAMAVQGIGAFINPRYEHQVRLRSKELGALLAGRFDAVRGADA